MAGAGPGIVGPGLDFGNTDTRTMLDIVPDPAFARMLSRASATFRKVSDAAVEECRDGDPRTALALVETLLATKPMGMSDRRCMLALQVALGAVASLRTAGFPREIDFRQIVESVIRSSTPPRLVKPLAAALAPRLAERAAIAVECPNCQSPAPEIGWTRLVTPSGVPHGRFYLDPLRAVADALPGEAIPVVQAHLLLTVALARIDARVPVRACIACGLRYVSWSGVEAVEDHYLEALGGGVDLPDGRVVGRGNVFSHCYDQAALPLYLDRVLGGVAGQRLYEFGCAEGITAKLLGNLGATVCGSDLDRPKVRYGRSVVGCPDLHDEAEYFWSLPPRSLDGVYAFHSVEHLLAPDRFFDHFARIVRPGGALAVSVPNAVVAADGHVPAMGGSHLIGFDRAGLTRFFERHGFEVLDCQADDGRLPPERLDPIRGFPDWSGKPGDLTLVGRRRH